jgi:hypothetical protein
MTAGRRRGLKSWLVEPYQQIKLGLIFLLLNILFSILILSVFGYFIWDVYSTLEAYFQLSKDQGLITLSKLSTPLLIGGLLLLVFVGLSILISVKYTHRIYGPLVSITRFLDEWLSEKTPRPLILRNSDELKELAARLNLLSEIYLGGKRGSSLQPVYKFIDTLIEGRIPEKPLSLRDSDRLEELCEKLNTLAKKLDKES